MQTDQQPNRTMDPQLAALQGVEKNLEKIHNRLAFFLGLIILAMIWTFVNSFGG